MSPAAVRIPAQAKVNLALRVLAREVSGYHQIETIFARLELGDEVTVRVGGRGRSLDLAGEALPAEGLGPTERNLAWRAAIAFAEATGWPAGFAIEIEKRIPVGGGLGGGSADAGAVLRALNALAPHPLPPRELLGLAAGLGADVPFLTTTSPMALAWGRGERMLALPALPARDVLLALPDFGVSTADAYGWLSGMLGERGPAPACLEPAALRDWAGIAEVATNDFERPVFARHPTLAGIVERLRAAGARPALMSGSGSTVFGVFESAPTPGALARVGARVVATRTAARVVEPARIE